MTGDEHLDQLDALRAAGTRGKWHVAKSGAIDAGDYDTVIGPGDVNCMSYCYGGTSTIEGDNLPADAALIVAAVNTLPALIAEARKYRALREAGNGLADDLAAEEVLIAHQRRDIGSCLCGWGADAGHIGQSHATHVWGQLAPIVRKIAADELRAAAEIAHCGVDQRRLDYRADAMGGEL